MNHSRIASLLDNYLFSHQLTHDQYHISQETAREYNIYTDVGKLSRRIP